MTTLMEINNTDSNIYTQLQYMIIFMQLGYCDCMLIINDIKTATDHGNSDNTGN